LTGGVGKDELREFYSKRFIPQMPPDTEMTAISPLTPAINHSTAARIPAVVQAD
jgi:hypothetical protein